MKQLSTKEKEVWKAIFMLKGLKYPSGERVAVVKVVGQKEKYIILTDLYQGREYYCFYWADYNFVFPTTIQPSDVDFSEKLSAYYITYLKGR